MSPKWPGCVASNSGPEGQMVDSKSGKNKHEAAFCVRFSPDSQFFAVSYADGTVRVCNADLHCAGDAEARTAPSGIPDVERAAGLRAVQPERQRVASASFRFVSARHNPPPPRLRRLAALALIHLSGRLLRSADTPTTCLRFRPQSATSKTKNVLLAASATALFPRGYSACAVLRGRSLSLRAQTLRAACSIGTSRAARRCTPSTSRTTR